MASYFKQPDLKIFNTMTMQKEPFQTRVPGKVTMFVCGPTVQGYLHVGHARTYNFYDVVARYLSHLGFEVNFLMNMTDIDDRITEAAKQEGVDPMRLAEKYTKAFLEDMESLKIYTVTKYERVSNYVQETISEIASLIRSGTPTWWTGRSTSTPRSSLTLGSSPTRRQKELSLVPLELSVEEEEPARLRPLATGGAGEGQVGQPVG